MSEYKGILTEREKQLGCIASDVNQPSQFDTDCMETMGVLPCPPYHQLTRWSVRKNWQDFATMWEKNPKGVWVYDPHYLIKIAR
jgi:hypothetical protein